MDKDEVVFKDLEFAWNLALKIEAEKIKRKTQPYPTFE